MGHLMYFLYLCQKGVLSLYAWAFCQIFLLQKETHSGFKLNLIVIFDDLVITNVV